MNGCYITDSVELTEPIISITIDSLIVSQMTCFSYDNASVGIIATGPQPIPYLYSAYEVSNPLNIYTRKSCHYIRSFFRKLCCNG